MEAELSAVQRAQRGVLQREDGRLVHLIAEGKLRVNKWLRATRAACGKSASSVADAVAASVEAEDGEVLSQQLADMEHQQTR
eukprot:6229522-Prymnesium_polylepis.1